MKQFYLSSASRSTSPTSTLRSSIDTELPFPLPLPRSDFLSPVFNPSTYLSELAPNRHQALEDLRADLEVRSRHLTDELLDLVNAHYADFLTLGSSLQGGHEKTQGLEVGLLSFQREVKGMRRVVVKKEGEITDLLAERREVREKLDWGRKALQWEERVEWLSDKLSISSTNWSEPVARLRRSRIEDIGADGERQEYLIDDLEGSDEEYDDDDLDLDTARADLLHLEDWINDYRSLEHMAESLGLDKPFVAAQHHRLSQIRDTLLLDLSIHLKDTKREAARDLRVLAMYRDLDAANDAIVKVQQRN